MVPKSCGLHKIVRWQCFLDSVQDQILIGLCTTKQSVRAAIYHELTISYTLWVLIIFIVTRNSFRRVISMSLEDQIACISVYQGCVQKEARSETCGWWKLLKLWVRHQEIRLVKCNTYYEDKFCACCFDSARRFKNNERPSYVDEPYGSAGQRTKINAIFDFLFMNKVFQQQLLFWY